MANFPVRYDSPKVPQLWADLGTERIPWVHAPRFGWACTITALDVAGAYANETITITIPTLDFVTGRLVVTFDGGGLGAPVEITADAPAGDDEDDLGNTLTTAITTAIGTTLAGTIASVTNTDPNVVVVVCEAGVGPVTATPSYTPAQQTSVTWGGTLVDGEYSVTITPDQQGFLAVEVPNDRAAAVPVDADAMAAAFEVTAEALIATDLAGVIVSADATLAVNLLIFEPGITATVVETVTNNTTHTFGGTETDGDYVTRFDHSSLPGGTLTVTTTRVGGAPASNTDLANAFEGDVEARALLSLLIDNADNTAGANVITFFPGVTGMNVTAVSAPAPGTLTVSDPTVVIADVTPGGPVITVGYAVTLDLNSIAEDQAFPLNVNRSWCLVHVTEGFGAGRTLTVGDAGSPAGVLGSTPIDLDTEGRSGSIAADAEYQPRPENAWVPLATIDLGSSVTVSAGSVLVEVLFTPNLVNTAA